MEEGGSAWGLAVREQATKIAIREPKEKRQARTDEFSVNPVWAIRATRAAP